MAPRSWKLPAMGGLAAYLIRLGDYLKNGDEKQISVATFDWPKVERAYGRSLTAEVRNDLAAATRSFVLLEESERTGSRVADVQTKIEACQMRASEFHQALPSPETCGGGYARLFINKNFSNAPPGGKLFEILHGLLTSFDVACTAALKELSELDPSAKKAMRGARGFAS